ncbi:ParB/RepB/Spo0J family partition protein [Halopiger aswanensis]|uniref:ParB family chromosome partitioning protein n=1 Tax=Halopiger aswanensis TaxID=148449 RepID=A0A3R7FSS2_9EURY|nr:ParB/RepB/Spo0J family partition protein [Halopiger aswanensis]RKD87654.1 ParB family chromosome partitioning protein [Halopiger aswanensis]
MQRRNVQFTENSEKPFFESGDIVIDRDDDSPNEAIVVNTPPIEASEWHVPGRGTLTEDNPDYPSDDQVVIVIYRDTIEKTYPNYTGAGVIRSRRLNQDNVQTYAFPSLRLQQVGELEPKEFYLDRLEPSPYHARNFEFTENKEYIQAIREQGYPDPPPYIRDCGNRFEIINGHKRVWASHIAGLESIPCECIYVSDEVAARKWIWSHLDDYEAKEKATARERLRSKFGSKAEQLETEVLQRKEAVVDE